MTSNASEMDLEITLATKPLKDHLIEHTEAKLGMTSKIKTAMAKPKPNIKTIDSYDSK